MSLKTVLVAPIFEGQIDVVEPGRSLSAYATEMAASHGAHLSIVVGVCRLSLPSAGMVPEAHALVAQANDERRKQAQTFGDDLLRRAQSAGAAAGLAIAQAEFIELSAKIVDVARAADVSIMQASRETLSVGQGVLEEVLFNSGRPLIVAPADAAQPATPKKLVLAWDGSAKAARAIGDAMPFIEQAEEIEIVTVEGDPNKSKRLAGADIAAHVARHARNVRLTSLSARDGDVARAVGEHASMTRADMIVMGAYGHSRLRQFVLGGVTRSMLQDPPVPALMSY